MASTSALSMAAVPAALVAQKRSSHDAFFRPLTAASRPTSASRPAGRRGLQARASSSMKEKAVTGLTAAALAAALVVPDIAEAAQPGLSPSLKNFLLSIVSGGVVLVVLLGAVIAVANFDPVKRA